MALTLNGENIQEALKRLEFGYMYNKSLIICMKDPVCSNVLAIDFICSHRPSINDGKMLINLVETKAKELGYDTLTIFAMCNKDFMQWYKTLGFTIYAKKKATHTDYGNKTNINAVSGERSEPWPSGH